MNPTTISFNIGQTIHGQPLTLTQAQATGGQREWILRRDQGDQRDDTAVISGLTDQAILDMAEAVRRAKAMRTV